MKGKLVAFNVPTKNHQESWTFYSALLGMQFARSFSEEVKSYHIPLSNEGHWMWISDRTAEDEQITCVFAVDDINEAVSGLTRAGGRAFVEPFDAPISPKMMDHYAENRYTDRSKITPTMGKFALVRDPDDNVICLMQPEEHAFSIFKLGKYETPLRTEVLETHERVLKAGQQLETEGDSRYQREPRKRSEPKTSRSKKSSK
jgi:predicted enzyme related to lactoylglutathione lyase